MHFSALAFPLLACALVVAAGCRTRGFNSGPRGSSPLLAPFLQDTVPFEKRPPMDYSLDTLGANAGKAAGDPGALLSPLSYWEKHLRFQGRVPRLLPGKTVLTALRNIRNLYWKVQPDFSLPADFSSLPREEQAKHVYKPGSTENGCLANVAEHWSDLQLHYFCALPQRVRACYRMTVQDALFRGKAIGVTPENNREKAWEACLDGGPSPLTDSVRSSKWLFTAEVKTFADTQWVQSEAGGEKVNLFEHLMFAQTFAFDVRQEQAILNAFYADLSAPGAQGESIDLTADATLCDTVRPPRAAEKSGTAGERCRPEKTFVALSSIGR
jgi:hypothetical protein